MRINEELTEYAPIIIPTLNRYVHLERCIHSLALNIGADLTEIYISVDYPPSQKYIEGYKQVVQYLQNTDDLSKFKKAHIIYQERNLGAVNNIKFLKDIIRKQYNSYIFSEDDNEFSHNYLIYVNKGLLLYKDDYRVISINAMRDTEWICSPNDKIVASKLFPAYGYGMWVDREKLVKEQINTLLLSKTSFSLKSIAKLFSKNKYIFALYVNGIVCSDTGLFYDENNMIRMCDTTLAIYMYLTQCFCIVPTISKSRNWGNDGSGVNMPKNTKIDPVKRWILDESSNFEYDNKNIEYIEANDNVAERFLLDALDKSLIFKAVLEYIFLLAVRYNRNFIIRIKKRLKQK